MDNATQHKVAVVYAIYYRAVIYATGTHHRVVVNATYHTAVLPTLVSLTGSQFVTLSLTQEHPV